MLLWVASVFAATVEIAVVGLHVAAPTPAASDAAAESLVDALEATGKAKVLPPDTVGRRIAGTEPYILGDFALGEARDRVKEARLLYDRAELDQAVPVLDDALTQLSAGLAWVTDARELREALVLKGMALKGMGDEGAAQDAFRRAVNLDPAAELDPVNHAPDIVTFYAAVRDAARKEPAATLDVSASVDATVYIDGREIGAAPQKGISLVPGEHYLLVRSADGGSSFAVIDAEPGATLQRAELVARHGMGEAAADAGGRSRQTRVLYKALGAYTKGALVVLGGETPTGVALQLYSPTSGTFSRALTAERGDDPVASITDLAPALVAFIGENGDIRADKVSMQVLALDIGENDRLARLVFEEKGPVVITQTAERKGVPWWVWAGGGALVAGGGAAAAIVIATQEPDDPNQGTVTFGPVP